MADEAEESRPLTDKQQRFVEEYVKSMNRTAAAILAGFSPRSAKQHAYDLMHLPMYAHVQSAFEEAKAQRNVRTAVEQEYVIHHLTQVVDTTKAPKDKVAALKLLGQHLGMYTEKQEISGADGKPLDVKVTHEVIDPSAS